jgi:hypothetical protein
MATTTPNFGWSVPTNTDLVKDGALAIETLGDAIDGRFGNVGTYPNQLVNVVSGVSRPIPFATLVGSTGGVVGSATVTFSVATRFTQTPVVIPVVSNANTTRTSCGTTAVSTTSFNVTVFAGTSVSTTTASVGFIAMQMTSASALG